VRPGLQYSHKRMQKSLSRKIYRGYIFVFLAALVYALDYLLVDYMLRNFTAISAENILVWGMSGAVILSAPFFSATTASRQQLVVTVKQDGAIILIISCITSLAAVLWLLAIESSSSGPVSLLTKSTVVYSFLLGVIFLNEKVSLLEIIGLLILKQNQSL